MQLHFSYVFTGKFKVSNVKCVTDFEFSLHVIRVKISAEVFNNSHCTPLLLIPPYYMVAWYLWFYADHKTPHKIKLSGLTLLMIFFLSRVAYSMLATITQKGEGSSVPVFNFSPGRKKHC